MRAKATTLYAACVPVLIALVFALTSLAFCLTGDWPWRRMPDWTVVALNVVPPMVAGAAVAVLVASLARRLGCYQATVRGHLGRLALVYLLAVVIVGIIVDNQGNSDFGLWSQIIEWPLAGLLALAAVDLIITARMRTHRAPAT